MFLRRFSKQTLKEKMPRSARVHDTDAKINWEACLRAIPSEDPKNMNFKSTVVKEWLTQGKYY